MNSRVSQVSFSASQRSEAIFQTTSSGDSFIHGNFQGSPEDFNLRFMTRVIVNSVINFSFIFLMLPWS